MKQPRTGPVVSAGTAVAGAGLLAVLVGALALGLVPDSGGLGRSAELATIVAIATVVLLAVLTSQRLSRSRRELERLSWRYASVLEATGEGIIGVHTDGRVVVANPAALELVGRDRDEVIGREVTDLVILGESTGDLHRLITELPAGQTRVDDAGIIERPDGERIDVHVKLATLDREDRRVGAVLTLRDLRPDKRAAAVLEQSERRAREIIETAGDAYVSLDSRGIVTGWNAAATRTFGWTPEEVMGAELGGFLLPERYRVAHRRGLERYARTGEARVLGQPLQLQALHRDGRELPIELTIWTVDRTAGEVGFSAFLRDVSERRAAEEAIRASERRLRQAEEVAELGSWEWDVRTGELAWSPGSYRLNDRDPDTFQPTFEGWLETVVPDDRDLVVNAVTAALEEGDRYEVEYRSLHRNGSVHLVHTIGAVERDDDGGALRVIGTARDVTEERLLERLKDEFTAIASHELRTPLTSVHAALCLIDAGVAGDLPEQAAQMVSIATRNTDRLIRLINDLLDVERLTAGKVDLRYGPTDLADLLGEVADSVRGMADDFHVPLVLDVPRPLDIHADGDRLVQIVTNLVGNAIKFSPAGAPVVVHARTLAGDEVELEVRDRGRGIPASELAHVFDRFRQVDATDGRRTSGSGLGLAIAKELVELHGGTIELASDGPGSGTTATVRLPRRPRGHDDSVVETTYEEVATP